MGVRFHHVIMKKGIIEFPHPESIPDKDRRILHEMSVKPFGVGLGNFSGINEFTPEEVSQ